jgi:hypothetical protein
MNDLIAAELIHKLDCMNKTLDIIAKQLILIASGDLK